MTVPTGRRAARRRYHAVQDHAAVLNDDLFLTGDRDDRADLLEEMAGCETELAALQAAAYGPAPLARENGRDLTEALASSAELLRLVAKTERLVAAAEWTAAGDLEAGQRIVFGLRWIEVTAIDSPMDPDLVCLTIATGDVLVRDVDDLFRTGGLGTGSLAAMVMTTGAGGLEAMAWWRLATTATHSDRAGLIQEIRELAADRVGYQAVEALAYVAESELHLGGSTDPYTLTAQAAQLKRGVLVLVVALVVSAGVLPGLISHLHALPGNVRHAVGLLSNASFAAALAVPVVAVARVVGHLLRRVLL